MAAGGTRPAIAWSWPQALSGAVYALPAAAVAVHDPQAAVPLALGVLPSALLPIPGPRRKRVAILVAGFVVGASLFLGGLLAHLPVVVGAVLLLVAVTAAAVISSVAPRGQILLILGVPLVAAGLSYDDYSTSAQTFWLMLLGATYAWLVSLLWPEREAEAGAARVLPDRRAMLAYGVRMGLAAALAYLFADALQLDHPGWAPAACLLVARPQLDLLQSRGVGRVAAVCVGALAAALVLHLSPPDGVYAALTIAVLAATAATRGSRWYVTSAFTTFFVFLLLLFDHPDQTEQKLNERVGETMIGVVLAYVFGWLVPWVLARRRTDSHAAVGDRAGRA